ncbi:MAG: IPT/TIG domain-containing protein [Pyrinomonadaceae bacterium]|nr:IPT/TIG domain-containing protein [Phycisphaerales bacterium]
MTRQRLLGLVLSFGVAGAAVERSALGGECPCDWNQNNALNSQDFFDFVGSFFVNDADFNTDGFTNSQDLFDFLSCFFEGCSFTPVITSFSPQVAEPGDIITVRGSGFGRDRADLCALIVNPNGQVVGYTRVLDSSDSQLTLRLNSIQPGATVGTLMVAMGDGSYDLTPLPSEMAEVTDPFWVWQSTGQEPAAAPRTIELRDPGAGTGTCDNTPVLDSSGRLVFEFPSVTCPPNTRYRIQVDACLPTTGCYWIDVGGELNMLVAMSAEDCFALLCQYFDDALTDRGIPVTCDTLDNGTTTRFRVRRTGGMVFSPSSGYICITPP